MFPAPGMPPNSPEKMFPTPWPTNSRFGWWVARVMESAINDMSKVLIEASRGKHQGRLK